MSDATASKKLPHNVRVLGLSSLLNDVASEMIFPLLPSFLLTVLGGNRFYLGMIEGAADSLASLVKLWSGGRSDQVRRRKGFVLFGYTLANLARPMIGLVTSPWQLLTMRLADRFGKGIRAAPRDALIADSTDESNRAYAFGFNRSMDHLGAAIGPLIAAAFLYVWPESLRTLFLLSIIPGLSVVVMLFFQLQETPATEPPKSKLQLTLKPFDGNFKRYLLALVVFTLGNSSDAFLLVRAGELGVSPQTLPLLWCVFHLAKSSSNLVLGHAADRVGARPMIYSGWIIYALVYVGFGMAANAVHIWILFLLYAFFFGLTEPSEKALVTEIVGKEYRGLAYGWYNFAMGIALLPASLLFGAIYQRFGPQAAFGTGATLAITATLLLTGVKNQKS
jgi:MFS family permease